MLKDTSEAVDWQHEDRRKIVDRVVPPVRDYLKRCNLRPGFSDYWAATESDHFIHYSIKRVLDLDLYSIMVIVSDKETVDFAHRVDENHRRGMIQLELFLKMDDPDFVDYQFPLYCREEEAAYAGGRYKIFEPRRK